MNKKIVGIVGIMFLALTLILLNRHYIYNIHPWDYYEIEQARDAPFLYEVYKIEDGSRIMINLVDDVGEALSLTCNNTYSNTLVKKGLYNQWTSFRVEKYNVLVFEDGTVVVNVVGLSVPVIKNYLQSHTRIIGLRYYDVLRGIII